MNILITFAISLVIFIGSMILLALVNQKYSDKKDKSGIYSDPLTISALILFIFSFVLVGYGIYKVFNEISHS